MVSPTSSTATLHGTIGKDLLLKAVTPAQTSRYNTIRAANKDPKFPVLYPAEKQLGGNLLDDYMHNLRAIPHPWKKFVHPDGKPYFRHTYWNIVTEVNIRDPSVLEKLESWHSRVNEIWVEKKARAPMTEDLELYLALEPEEGYYYVNHTEQEIFWLQDVRLGEIAPGDDPKSMSFDLFILRNYYSHLENFPCHNKLPDKAMDLLHGALTYACTDHLTSNKSATAPWNATDCKTFLELLDGLKEDSEDCWTAGYRTWFVARLLSVILHSRSVHNYGMHDARVDRLAGIKKSQRGLLELLAGAFTFWAHPTYVKRLEIVWGDSVVSLTAWHELLGSLLVEWSDSNLLATVILSANMAFLALSDVSSIERTSSIVSTFFSIGSIAVGLHHIWRHRVKKDSTVEEALRYFEGARRRTQSMTPLAFFLSLPLIFLSWSLVMFACSVAIFAFTHLRPWRTYVVTGVILSTVVGIVVTTVVFFFGMFDDV